MVVEFTVPVVRDRTGGIRWIGVVPQSVALVTQYRLVFHRVLIPGPSSLPSRGSLPWFRG